MTRDGLALGAKNDTLIRCKSIFGIAPSYLSAGQFTGKAGKHMMKLRRRNLKWADVNMAEPDPTNLITHFARSNKAEAKSPKTVSWYSKLTPDEIDKVISTQNPLTALGCRNLATLVTLLDTGLRVSELSNLRFQDAHIGECYVKMLGKGARERVVPVGVLAQRVLWRYLFHFRPEPPGEPNDYLFLTSDGKRLQSNAIKLLLRRWGRRAGVPRLHAHLCRHTYATNFLNYKCGDVFRLQQILGHSTPQMVRRYVHYASAQAMIRGHVVSPVNQPGIRKLRTYNSRHIRSRKREAKAD